MNSDLNPEAPEFYPNFKSVSEGGYSTCKKSIKSSNRFPSGAALQLFKTITDFNFVTSQLRESVIVQSNKIIVTENPAIKLKLDDNHYNAEKISDANESMLDRINLHINNISEEKGESAKGINGISPWNIKPTITKLETGSATFIGAKNIPCPQWTFKDVVDNSNSLWVPKISDKPNNIKPLALNILYNNEGEAVGYEHPYKIELELYHPPAHCLVPDPEPPSFPPPIEKTKLTYVDTEAKVDELVKHLSDVEELAVDVEHHSYRTYQGITCLIQISTIEGDFIIDALAVRQHIHKLNLSFTDPKKIKVFHGAEMDVLWLQRDFGVYIVGLFDTHQAAKILKIKGGLSLKSLLQHYCNVVSDKRFQLADWRIRPLPDELIMYARMDTHYLLYIWRMMKEELIAFGAGSSHFILSVFEQSRLICGKTYKKEVIGEDSHLSIYVKSKKSFNTQQMAALKMLYKWRDSQARVLDESTGYLMPNHMLLALAETLPREVQGVSACCSPMPPFVKRNLVTINRMLLSCRELPVEPQLFQMPPSIRSMVQNPNPLISFNMHDFTHYQEFSEDQPINMDLAAESLENYQEMQPEIEVFKSASDSEPSTSVVSNLNVDAKLFFPPYDRYRKYRTFAQQEEIKEFKEKEAKISAISKGTGNELIKSEVLVKLQDAKAQVEKDTAEKAPKSPKGASKPKGGARPKAPPAPPAPEKPESSNKTAQRKRKISTDKKESKDSVAGPHKPSSSQSEPKSNPQNKAKNNPEPKPAARYNYHNANYKKLFNENEKPLKQPKMKFKKHK